MKNFNRINFIKKEKEIQYKLRNCKLGFKIKNNFDHSFQVCFYFSKSKNICQDYFLISKNKIGS